MDISLLVSFYRVQQHLPKWLRHAERVAHEVKQAGRSLEYVIVTNDAQPDEIALLETFAQTVPNVQVHHVGRESLYASWNRAAQHATGQIFGFWNADDQRTAQALIDGWRLAQGGARWVYFPWTNITTYGRWRVRQNVFPPIPPEPQRKRRFFVGPFVMFTADFFREVGTFDPRFRITGDWEWVNRALDQAPITPSTVNAGRFHIHGGNLSGENTAKYCESNIVHLLSGSYDDLHPTPPDIMRQTWERWASDLPTLPTSVQAQLWGEGAQAEWDAWQIADQHRRRRVARSEVIRSVPRWFIDTFRLRGWAARLKLVKSAH